jgi:hypothetical protein
MVLDRFHPAVSSWFIKQFAQPTEPQSKAWPAIKDRRHTLIAAPTGSGKTLSAFLAAIDDLVRQGIDGKLEDAGVSADEGLVEILRGRLEAIGPVTSESLAETMALPAYTIESALMSLESEGFVTLCLSGRIVWIRLSPQKGVIKSVGSGPVRSTPIALLNKKNLAIWDMAFPQPRVNDDLESLLSSSAQLVYDHLLRHRASFFTDFVENTGLLKTQVEEGLAELVAGGLITADSFTGLRALLTPSNKRPSNHNAKRKAPAALFGMENAGRWSRVQRRGQSLNGAKPRRST